MEVEVSWWTSSLEQTVTMGLWSVVSALCQYGELQDEALETWMKLMQDKEITWSVLLCDCVNRGICLLLFYNFSHDTIVENGVRSTGLIYCPK